MPALEIVSRRCRRCALLLSGCAYDYLQHTDRVATAPATP